MSDLAPCSHGGFSRLCTECGKRRVHVPTREMADVRCLCWQCRQAAEPEQDELVQTSANAAGDRELSRGFREWWVDD